jgi:hypothetical protein
VKSKKTTVSILKPHILQIAAQKAVFFIARKKEGTDHKIRGTKSEGQNQRDRP